MSRVSKIALSMFIIMTLIVSLSGCGKTSTVQPSDEKSIIEFWHYWDGNNGKAINELVANFNSQNDDVEVKPVFIPGGELNTKLQAAIGSGTIPDVAAVDITEMARLKSTGKLLPLDDYIKDNNIDLDLFYPALLEYGKSEGKTFSLPVSTNNLALFYNKDIFKNVGLDPDKPPITWDEMEQYCSIITSKLPGTYGFEFYTQVGDNGEGLTWQLQPFLWQSGADFIKDGQAAFNNKAGENALGFLVDLIQKKYAPVGSWDDFSKGTAAMVVDGSWMVGIWKDSLNFDFGTAMLPIPQGGQHATNMGGEQIFAFNNNEKENAAAARFIAYMVDKDTQIEWDKKTTFMPVRKDIAEDQRFINWAKNTEPRLIPFIEQQQYAHARPSIVEYPAASLAFAKEIEKAYYGKVSVKEALLNAENAVNSAINK